MSLVQNYSDDEEAGESAMPAVVGDVAEQKDLKIVAAPHVDSFGLARSSSLRAAESKILYDNPKVDEAYRRLQGPLQPHQREWGIEGAYQNHPTGHVEEHHLSRPAFDEQYLSYRKTGIAVDPSDWQSSRKRDGIPGLAAAPPQSLQPYDAAQSQGEMQSVRRKRQKAWDPSAEKYLGPWAPFEVERTTEGVEITSSAADGDSTVEDAHAAGEAPSGAPVAGKAEEAGGGEVGGAEEAAKQPAELVTTSIFHGKKESDYQGRSWIEAPRGLKIVDAEDVEASLPRRKIHSYVGHTMGVQAIRFFPKTGHLLLSAGMDSKVMIWDCHNQRKCMRTYLGHTQAVRDVNFTYDGRKFYSCSYDKNILLWDTEYGKIIGTFTNGKTPYCVSIHPDPSKQNDFIVGSANKRAVEFDADTGKIVQEYNEHLAAVNTVTFCDENRKIVTTSDDKKIFVWEHGIPVVVKHISEPTMHSMPAVRLHPTGKFFAAQSMDNKIVVYEAVGRFRFQGRKTFKGHMNAGYAIQPDFSPDGNYIVSGDAGGKLWFWDWKTMKNFRTLQAHDGVAICSAWHPFMPSRVASCGWDGVIKLWD